MKDEAGKALAHHVEDDKFACVQQQVLDNHALGRHNAGAGSMGPGKSEFTRGITNMGLGRAEAGEFNVRQKIVTVQSEIAKLQEEIIRLKG